MQSRLSPPVEFALDDDVTVDDVVAALVDRFDVETSPATPYDRVYLDSFDRRLARRGASAERQREGTICVHDDGHLVGRVTTSGPRGDRVFATDLPEGAVRDRLAVLLKERALLPQVRVRSHHTAMTVRNDDDKTVVRVRFDAPAILRRGQPARPLAARLSVVPVLGYRDAFTTVTDLITAMRGVVTAPSSLAAEAMGAPPVAPSFPAIERSTRAHDAMVVLCRHLADTIEANLGGTLADLDTEFLHDLRVAVRRTRSVLREMRAVLPGPVRERARSDLRWIQQITGPTRDLDVQLLNWPDAIAELAPQAAADLEPLHALLQHKRLQAFRLMRRHLRGAHYADAWAAWRKVLAAPESTGVPGPDAGRPIGDVAGRRVGAVYRQMVKAGMVIDDRTPPEALHELRKRGKELRYLLELFGPAWPGRDVRTMVSTVKELQDVLGRFQDCQVESQFLRSLGPELARGPGGADALIALGLHLDRLSAEQHRAREAFSATFRSFAARDHRRMVNKTFAP